LMVNMVNMMCSCRLSLESFHWSGPQHSPQPADPASHKDLSASSPNPTKSCRPAPNFCAIRMPFDLVTQHNMYHDPTLHGHKIYGIYGLFRNHWALTTGRSKSCRVSSAYFRTGVKLLDIFHDKSACRQPFRSIEPRATWQNIWNFQTANSGLWTKKTFYVSM
jgi:hypothetical protein